MTAPTDSTAAAPPARPHAPVAAAFVVLAALLAGAGALAVSSVAGSDLVRVVIALVLVVGGVWVTRPARDERHPLTLAIGAAVVRGIGTSYVVLGAYLAGLALLTASIPDSVVLDGESAGPSPTLVIVMVYGVPAVALLALATTGMRAWTAGAGALLPMITVLLMAQAGAGTAVVSVTLLVVGAVLAVVVFRSTGGSPWGNLASAAAAMACSFAFGTGTSPFGTLGATQLAGSPEAGPAGRLSAAALIVVLAGALLIAAFLVLVAVARRDLAGATLAASIFTMPPVLLSTWLRPDARWPAEAVVALTGVPAVIALAAMLAIRQPHLRTAIAAALPQAQPAAGQAAGGSSAAEPPATGAAEPLGTAPSTGESSAVEPPATGVTAPPGTAPPGTAPSTAGSSATEPPTAEPPTAEPPIAEPPIAEPPTAAPAQTPTWPPQPSPAMTAAACAVIVAAAAVAFVVLAVPVFAWDPRLQGGVALVVLVGAGALGYWLPTTPGAAASIVALLGLGLASPWARLLTGGWATASDTERVLTGVLDFLGAAVLAWFLIRRHPRPGVFAAATYALAGGGAALLGSILFNADYLTTGAPAFGSEFAPVAIVALPLVLLALAACGALLRGHLAAGQAIGAVVFAAAGFVPLKVLVGQFSGGTTQGYALQFALNPLTPTDWLQASAAFRDVTGPALAAVLVMVVFGLAASTSLALRPSAPLAGAIALLLLAGVQTSLLTVLESSTTDDVALLGQVLGGLAAVVAVVGIATAVTAARRT